MQAMQPPVAGPGAAHVLWAAGPGRASIERVFERSPRLNGDAVVVFMRSLAAISQEELVPVLVTDRPRCVHQCETVSPVISKPPDVNGDSAVVSMRSLAAISKDGLVPMLVTDRPRSASCPTRTGL